MTTSGTSGAVFRVKAYYLINDGHDGVRGITLTNREYVVATARDKCGELETILSGGLDDPADEALARQVAADIDDADYITQRSERYVKEEQWLAAEILFERRCVLLAKAPAQSEAYTSSLMRLATIYQKQGKSADAREARREIAAKWEKSGKLKKSELADRLLNLAQVCMAANDTPEAERFAKKALTLREADNGATTEALVECLQLMMSVATRQKRSVDAKTLQRKIETLQNAGPPPDEIERGLSSYVRLPEGVDLTLHRDGITLHTSDFPRVILESTGLDLSIYFTDALKDVADVNADEKQRLVDGMLHLFNTVETFVSDGAGGRMVRSEASVIALPPGLSQGFVQNMTVEKVVTFTLDARLPDDARFTNVTGVSFDVGGRRFGVSDFDLRAIGNKCIVTPILAQTACVLRPPAKGVLGKIKSRGKDLIVGAAMKMKKLPPIEVPIVLTEFRQSLSDAVNFKSLLAEPDKDLVMFIERSAGIAVEDPLIRSLLERGIRIKKLGAQIELVRQRKSRCDLGGLALDFADTIKLQLAKNTTEVDIAKLSGVGVEIAFQPPEELQQLGVDLRQSLPKTIQGFTLSARDGADCRKLIVNTDPGCWIALNLNALMQPATDSAGNWQVVGVAQNPISGVPQKFFLRLDCANNLNMTPMEIAEMVAQTAFEGTARNIGRLIGKLLSEF